MQRFPPLGPVERVVSRVCRLRLENDPVPCLQIRNVSQRPLWRVLVVVTVRELAVLFLREACARTDALLRLLLVVGFVVVVDLSKQVPVPLDRHVVLVADHRRRVDGVRSGNKLRMVSIRVLLHNRMCLLHAGCCRFSGSTVPLLSLTDSAVSLQLAPPQTSCARPRQHWIMTASNLAPLIYGATTEKNRKTKNHHMRLT